MSEHHHDTAHHPEPLSPAALRAKAIESLLIEKGLLSTDLVDRVIDRYEHEVGPMTGARIVARAWVDPAFKARLLADATSAAEELGIAGHHLCAVENTPRVHNVVVCTLCSCYPWALLGLPPTWYKSPAYRARTVLEPRVVLREFGVEVPEDVEVRVWDSSAELRYLVIPERPAGTEHLGEAELAALITREAMIGTGRVAPPAAARSGA